MGSYRRNQCSRYGFGQKASFLVPNLKVVRETGCLSPLFFGQVMAMPLNKPSGLKVLILDDDVDCAESAAILLRLNGHEATTAHNGLGAVSAVIASSYDVMIVDIGLPGMSGFDFVTWVKGLAKNPPPLLIAVTGYCDEATRTIAADIGFDLFFPKPMDPIQLQDLLEERGRQGADGVLPLPAHLSL